jgi:hypothetical protein
MITTKTYRITKKIAPALKPLANGTDYALYACKGTKKANPIA